MPSSASIKRLCRVEYPYYYKNEFVQSIFKLQSNAKSYISLLPIEILKIIISIDHFIRSDLKIIEKSVELHRWKPASKKYFAIQIRNRPAIMFKYIGRGITDLSYRFSKIEPEKDIFKVEKKYTHKLKFWPLNAKRKIELTRVFHDSDDGEKYYSSYYDDYIWIGRIYIDPSKMIIG